MVVQKEFQVESTSSSKSCSPSNLWFQAQSDTYDRGNGY